MSDQIEVHLIRKGPMHISDLVASVRHNGNARQVHEALKGDKRFRQFTYRHHDGKAYRERRCVLINGRQDEWEYVPYFRSDSPQYKARPKRPIHPVVEQHDFL